MKTMKIMKTMCPPGYHHSGFVATHTLGHIVWALFGHFLYASNFYIKNTYLSANIWQPFW